MKAERVKDKMRAPNLIIVSLTIAAWLAISNHCALGGLMVAKMQPAMPPLHCHGDQQSPAKKSGGEEMPCCKMLRATITSEAKAIQVAGQNFVPIQDWIVAELISVAERPLVPLELDTGPPFADSFAESVLQRSILAHAPPSLA